MSWPRGNLWRKFCGKGDPAKPALRRDLAGAKRAVTGSAAWRLVSQENDSAGSVDHALAFEAIYDQQAHLGHVLDGVADPFPAETGGFHAAVGHVIDAVGGDVVHDHAARLDVLEGVQGAFQVVGKDTSLETVNRVVDRLDR